MGDSFGGREFGSCSPFSNMDCLSIEALEDEVVEILSNLHEILEAAPTEKQAVVATTYIKAKEDIANASVISCYKLRNYPRGVRSYTPSRPNHHIDVKTSTPIISAQDPYGAVVKGCSTYISQHIASKKVDSGVIAINLSQHERWEGLGFSDDSKIPCS